MNENKNPLPNDPSSAAEPSVHQDSNQVATPDFGPAPSEPLASSSPSSEPGQFNPPVHTESGDVQSQVPQDNQAPQPFSSPSMNSQAAKPMQSPQAPQPGQPLPPSPTSPLNSHPTYQMPPKKSGPKKGMLLGIIGGIVGLLLIVVAVIVGMMLFGGPNSEDFAKADDKIQEATSAYNTGASLDYVSAYGATETTAKNNAETLVESNEKVTKALNDFEEMKATRDQDVRAKYDKLKDKLPKYQEKSAAYIEVFEKVMPVVISINNSNSTSSDNALAIFKRVRAQLDSLDLDSKVNKDYVRELISQIDVVEGLTKRVITMRDSNKYDSKLINNFYDETDKLTKIDKDWMSNLEKISKDGDIRDELSGLQTTLIDKRYSSK